MVIDDAGLLPLPQDSHELPCPLCAGPMRTHEETTIWRDQPPRVEHPYRCLTRGCSGSSVTPAAPALGPFGLPVPRASRDADDELEA